MSKFSYAVLSIDGGGIRGIIPAAILKEIEKQTGQPIAKSFDLIAGTSTGGILANGLALTDENGEPKKSAAELLELYTGEKGKRIFKKPWGFLNKLRMLFFALFKPKNLESLLKEEFGDARLKDAYTDVLITSYDTHNKKPFYFRSSAARANAVDDFAMTDVCRATSAAPTYFPPKSLQYDGEHPNNHTKELGLIDGGVFANNPSLLAYVEAIELWRKDPDYKKQFQPLTEVGDEKGMVADTNPDNYAPPILLVSLGTGQTRNSYRYKKTKGWGIKWLLPLMDILMQGVAESVDYQMNYMLPPYLDKAGNQCPRYFRLNIDIAPEYADFSDTSDKTVAQLEKYGQEVVKKYETEIKEICELLKPINNKREIRKFMMEEA